MNALALLRDLQAVRAVIGDAEGDALSGRDDVLSSLRREEAAICAALSDDGCTLVGRIGAWLVTRGGWCTTREESLRIRIRIQAEKLGLVFHWAPESASHVDLHGDTIAQAVEFPYGEHDDIVDALNRLQWRICSTMAIPAELIGSPRPSAEDESAHLRAIERARCKHPGTLAP